MLVFLKYCENLTRRITRGRKLPVWLCSFMAKRTIQMQENLTAKFGTGSGLASTVNLVHNAPMQIGGGEGVRGITPGIRNF